MNAITLAGIVLAVVSFGLLLLSRAQLGKSFAFTPKARELVTHGLYSRIRNPMYVFVDLTVIGLALATHFWYLACVLLEHF
jgi:protein-S-isoprenylcysteine O-methyltransferase Ste14